MQITNQNLNSNRSNFSNLSEPGNDCDIANFKDLINNTPNQNDQQSGRESDDTFLGAEASLYNQS